MSKKIHTITSVICVKPRSDGTVTRSGEFVIEFEIGGDRVSFGITEQPARFMVSALGSYLSMFQPSIDDGMSIDEAEAPIFAS